MNPHTNTPPIQYLCAFREAAERGSFAKAADALNVTPSAISQQIKTLENILGIPLFERSKRAISLTTAGRDFMRLARETLAVYETGFAGFLDQYGSPTIRISTHPYVATEVIIPNLAELSERYPAIDLTMETSCEVVDLATSRLDGAIRFGVPPWGDNDAKLIGQVEVNIVANKRYLEQHPITFSDFFQNQTILHTRTNVNDWDKVRQHFGVEGQPKKELYFDSYNAMIKAAEEGLGLAIGLFPIINHTVTEGRLQTVAPANLPIEEAYYLVTKANERKRRSMHQLHQWLVDIFQRL